MSLINSAFCMVIPPQTNMRKEVKVLPPMEAYLKHLLVVRLVPEDNVISLVSKQILRFPWSHEWENCGKIIVKYLLKACLKGRYKTLGAVVSVIASLKKAKPELLTRFIDAVLEEIRFAIEHPIRSDQQRTIVYVRLLGELHMQALVASSVVFDQLYEFVNFDHNIPDVLRQISEKQTFDATDMAGVSSKVLKGPLGITHTIQEEEEIEEEEEKVEGTDKEAEQLAPVAVSLSSKYDPRVPSTIDPPSSVMRIKLICTLLDSSALTLITASNKGKIDNFLASFQRYLFTKNTLPADIEFSLLDTFDLIDSKMKNIDNKRKASSNNSHIVRYKTWLDAHNATVSIEEIESMAKEKAKTRLLMQAGVRNVTTDIDYSSNVNEEDVGDGLVASDDEESLDDVMSLVSDDACDSGEDTGEGDSDDNQSTNESMPENMSEDEVIASEEGSEDNDDDSFDEGADMDEAIVQETYMKKLEEEAFERELRRITVDALEKGKIAARTGATAKVSDTMPSASQFVRKKAMALESVSDVEYGSQVALGGETGMSFKFLKRGHKGRVEAKQLVVPTDTNLAKVASKQDDEAARERDMLKERVLRYERSSEQAYSGNVY